MTGARLTHQVMVVGKRLVLNRTKVVLLPFDLDVLEHEGSTEKRLGKMRHGCESSTSNKPSIMWKASQDGPRWVPRS